MTTNINDNKPLNYAYQAVYDAIMAALDKGVIPWRKPWIGGVPMNVASKRAYRGINAFILGIMPYSSPYWGTYKNISDKGGQVRKGEHGTRVVFWTILKKNVRDDAGDVSEKKIFFLKYYTVFNVEQCDGLDIQTPNRDGVQIDPLTEAENLIGQLQNVPPVEFGGNRAAYSPKEDKITLPCRDKFDSAAAYYCTRFHETIHSTGHPNRLNRFAVDDPTDVFGSASYSREELVAEFGAAFLCNEVGIVQETVENSAAYIQNWMKKIQNEPKILVSAASAAQKAVDYLLDRESGESTESTTATEEEMVAA